jgi:hypothetical protein
MKKIFTISTFIIFSIVAAHAQWVPVGSGMDNYVWGSAVYNGNLYASGNFEHADGNSALAIAKWNGSAWSDVGGGFQQNAFSNVIRGLIVYNNELIAGGYVDSVSGMAIHKVARWNGSTWSAMGTDCPISTINCFVIHNGELYAGGEGSGAVKVCVAKWDGTNWTGLDVEGNNTDVWSMASYNGALYAGGAFSNFNGQGIGGVAKWDGSTWSNISTGFSQFDIVRALAVFNNKLYIGGGFTSVGGVSAANIASYDGSVYAPLNGGVNAPVQSLLSYGNKLFVGGSYWMVDGNSANRASYWDGTSWTVLGTDLGAGARTISVFNNELYFGGEGAFNNQAYIAKWSAGIFTGIKKNLENKTLCIYPVPASDYIYINDDKDVTRIYIYDVNGDVLSETVATSKNIAVDVTKLLPGTYFITTDSGDCSKFTVTH